MRVRVLVISLALVVGSAAVSSAAPTAAEPTPVRSGTILGGTGLEMGGGQPWEDPAFERSGCEYAVDCATWLHSGCNPALPGLDPALTASIVDVAGLGGGRTRRWLRLEAPPIPPWGLWPGVVVQLWRADCTEIRAAKRHTIGSNSNCDWDYRAGVTRCEVFPMPADVKWMTLSAYVTTAQLSWYLS